MPIARALQKRKILTARELWAGRRGIVNGGRPALCAPMKRLCGLRSWTDYLRPCPAACSRSAERLLGDFLLELPFLEEQAAESTEVVEDSAARADVDG